MNPAALLPHEKLCPDCGGDREVAEVRPCTSSTATEPFMTTGRMIPCPNRECDGTGIIVTDRRAVERPDGEIAEAFTDLRLAVVGWQERAVAAEAKVGVLNDLLDVAEREIASARRMNADQAELLRTADYSKGV